jgi:hypothetical protein
VSEHKPVTLKDSTTAALLAWLVPGLGHVYQGRFAKGIIFFVCLMGTFVWGLYLGEWKSVYWTWDDRKPLVGGLFRLGMGLPPLPALLQSFRPEGAGLPLLGKFQAAPSRAELQELHARLNRRWHIAEVYTWIACLLNIMAILDAYGGAAHRSEHEAVEEPAHA